MENLTKGVTLSIKDAINDAARRNPSAQQQFLNWLDEQDQNDVSAINAALTSGSVSTRELADLLKAQGAPITGNRLYDYRKTLLGQRVTG